MLDTTRKVQYLPSLLGTVKGDTVSSLQSHAKPELQANPIDIFSKGVTRAAIDLADIYLAKNAAQLTGENGGLSLMTWSHVFAGIGMMMYAADHDADGRKSSSQMAAMIGIGDFLTALGLSSQAAAGGGPGMLPITLAGIGLSTLGTAGWILAASQNK
ncbi:MAG: hypothetical protein HYU64_05095 [Armatimonadetes bacterium]|nr:hypothetical protein [Armatimonadota bacterium]